MILRELVSQFHLFIKKHLLLFELELELELKLGEVPNMSAE